ncbi:MAG: hypothetical protein OXH09_01350, partial [Gammaproteobacteria bacterium]|nr:hypothetical protein [Gammaproteobacteria bacterium]
GAMPVIRLVEVPDYRPFHRLGFLGIYAAETRWGRAFAVPVDPRGKSRDGRGQAPPLRIYAAERSDDGMSELVLPYSERGYPLNTTPPSESTPPRA